MDNYTPIADVSQSPPTIVVQEPESPPESGRGENKLVTSREIMAALTRMGYAFRLNEVSNQVEVNGTPITDGIQAEIRTKMRDSAYKRMSAIEDAYFAYAMNHSYHPVKDYLNGLQWDGNEHIRALASHLHDTHSEFANGDSVSYVWFKRWMVGAVAKVFEQAQNVMLVLEGPQDIGKSTLAEWLASPQPNYYIEAAVHPDDKDSLVRLHSKWIWSVEELGSTIRRADRESLKSFITLKEVTVRRAYGHYDVNKPALASLIGSLNSESGFLTDPTGNRRFMTVNIQHVGWKYRDCIDPNQLWAEAVTLYRAGEPWRLDATERAIQNDINSEYEVEDPVENIVSQNFEIDPTQADWFTPSTDIVRLVDTELKGNSKYHSMSIATMLKKANVRAGRPYVKGIRTRGYWGVRPRPI